MNREETLQILAVLKAAYPSFYRDMKPQDAEGTVGLWQDLFAEESAALVSAAVKTLIATDRKGFPPHIGAVKEKLRLLQCPDCMTESEAWSLVYKALKRGLYHSCEEFDKLPTLLRRLVGSPNQLRDWAMMDADTVQSVVASNFQRSFRARQEADRDYRLMPPDTRAIADSFATQCSLDEALHNANPIPHP